MDEKTTVQRSREAQEDERRADCEKAAGNRSREHEMAQGSSRQIRLAVPEHGWRRRRALGLAARAACRQRSRLPEEMPGTDEGTGPERRSVALGPGLPY